MKYLLTFFLLLFALAGFCQNSQVKVTLKSGLTITGGLKELVPTDYVKMDVSGVETKVPMSDVASIETIEVLPASSPKEDASDTKKLDMVSGNYIITDKKDYPDTIKVQIGGREMEMKLVRGGSFIMGYDGRHSLAMESEPLHQVNLSSFYISLDHITREQVNALLNKDLKIKKPNIPFFADKWDQANEVIKAIVAQSNKKYRLCTEAEWEYYSLMDFSEKLYGSEEYYEWCSDFYGEYNLVEQTNPQGPATGKKHVFRSFNIGRNRWQRKFDKPHYSHYGIRIAISADEITNK